MTRLISMLLTIALAASPLSRSLAAENPASSPCGERTALVEHLRKTFGERRIGNGLSETGSAIELFAGPEGTFTLLATSPRGVSCLIASGGDWEPLPQPERYAAR